ncbi:MAG TPA: hypothetical protein VIA81_12450 [Acidimicrobiia bacterium]|jgi:hypothetical protein
MSTTAPPSTTTTAVVLAPGEAIARFSACLNEQGFEVGGFPTDAQGRIDLSALIETLGTDPVALRAALAECAPALALSGALDLTGEPVLRAAVLTQLINFAICMRSLGVEGFPEPDPDFDGTRLPFEEASLPTADPEYAGAIESCSTAVGAQPASP